MALVSFLPPVRNDVPHESAWMEFRKPASRTVKRARQRVESDSRRGINDYSVDIIKAFNAGGDDDQAVRRARKLAKLSEYDPDSFDRDTLLVGSIVAWSYTDAAGAPVPVTEATVGELDEETARWALDQVIGLMRPPTQEADKSTPGAAAPGA